jgi:hypothetical protein
LVGFVHYENQGSPGTPYDATLQRSAGAAGLVLAARPRAADLRRTRFFLIAFITGALSLWLVPAMLDWNRFRTAIAGFAAAELGRPVSIGGGVTLSLLPSPVFTAGDVSFPDQGDGVSAHLHALRLQVAILPLLSGHLVVRDLVLGEPVLQVPWPLPANLGAPVPPYVRRPFTARVEQGSVHIGGVAVTGIDAALHSDAASGALGMLGSARLAGGTWRLATSIGPPDLTGQTSLDLSVDGERDFAGTGGHLSGVLSYRTLDGHIEGHGPDLSRLIEGPAGAWHMAGPFTAAAGLMAAPALTCDLAGTAASVRAILHITGRAGLELGLVAKSLDVAAWAGAMAGLQNPALPLQLTLDAAAATLFGGHMTNLHARLAADGSQIAVEQVQVTLPGRARLTITGEAGRDRGGFWVQGPASLEAPDLRATLAWLRPVLPQPIGPPRGDLLRRATLAGKLYASAHVVSLSDMDGSVDGTHVTGGFGIGLAQRPGFGAGLVLDRLDLDEMAGLSGAWPAFDGDVFLRTGSARWRGHDLGAMDAAVHSDAAGVAVSRFTLQGLAGKLALTGKFGTDGSLADLHVTASAPELGQLASAVAAFSTTLIRLPHTGLWQGGAGLELTGAGPPRAWALQVHADAGDLRVETAATVDASARSAVATLTIRHPGAPRLLAAFGIDGAEQWLETGSFALLAHVVTGPGTLSVRDLDLTAAILRLSGRLDADFTQAAPRVSGLVEASTLALPFRSALPLHWLSGWDGTFQVQADKVLADLQPVAAALRTNVIVQEGAIVANVLNASLSGGSVVGQVAADTSLMPVPLAANLSLTDVALPSALTGLPLDIGGGTVTGTVSLDRYGSGLSDVSGDFSLQLINAQILGLDLPRIAHLATLHQASAHKLLASALTSGATPSMSGPVAGRIDHGSLSIGPALLASAAGTVDLTGTLALDGHATDYTATVSPAELTPIVEKPGARPLRVHVSGSRNATHVEADTGQPAPAPAKPARRSATPHTLRHH